MYDAFQRSTPRVGQRGIVREFLSDIAGLRKNVCVPAALIDVIIPSSRQKSNFTPPPPTDAAEPKPEYPGIRMG